MTRRTHLALLLALAAALALPSAAAAASPDRSDSGLIATAESWFARLWEPLAQLIGRYGTTGGPTIDPNGSTAPPPVSHHSSSEGGPDIDPNGSATQPPANNAEGDGGPGWDPNG